MNPRTLVSLLFSILLIHLLSLSIGTDEGTSSLPPTLCAASAGARLHAIGCDHPLAEDSARTRRALGRTMCWWTATAGDLDGSLDGVGERTARALTALRDRGHAPTRESLSTIPRLGSAARDAVLELDTRCGVRATD